MMVRMQLSSLLRQFTAAGLCAGILLLTSCESKDQKKSARPAPQAMAPSLEENPSAGTAAAAKPSPSAAAQTQAQAAQAEKPDQVAGIIAEAEKAYQSGEANYKAGHMDAAKQDFNRAVDILMQGPVDIKADDRLQQEFDKITEDINKLEMLAFKEGDGFSEQQAEPAPIDEANQVTFPADPNVKAKAEAELKTLQSDLPLIINDYVAGYINYFSTKGRATFEASLARSGRYRDMILRIFKEEGVPQDLIYLAQAESGFKPLALSKARARGMWQFMASRGVGYGLRRNWWVDDRQDPEKATRAAARHLKDLYNQFGDWYLAMAAYNSGPGNVQQAVKRTGYADFWELYKRNVLPAETKNYVPIILAMTIISKNPAQYGLDAVQPEAAQKYDVVRVDYPVDLRLVAECVDAPVDKLIELNPSLLRRTTPKDQPFDLHLPEGTKEKYETAIAAIPEDKRVAWRYYKVEAGDTLAGVARKYHTTERAIAQANNLEGTQLTQETKLVIPVSGSAAALGKISYSRYPSRYKVHGGDTVLSVAEDFGVPPEKLRRWNRLKGNQLARGRVLVVYKPLAPGEADKAPLRRHKKRAHSTAVAKASKPATTTSQKSASASAR
ncbi:MAG TPA: transglycosylase SLT domain-containing protein [Candidatus Angelobacter sp.]|nr:transglycosylase SLT domain-containing protein [Candidatus Angelobacter sp.]